MKPIEETHPSLKGKEGGYNELADTIASDDVQEYTVDKQVVKEAIAEVRRIFGPTNPTLDMLLKELKL